MNHVAQILTAPDSRALCLELRVAETSPSGYYYDLELVVVTDELRQQYGS